MEWTCDPNLYQTQTRSEFYLGRNIRLLRQDHFLKFHVTRDFVRMLIACLMAVEYVHSITKFRELLK